MQWNADSKNVSNIIPRRNLLIDSLVFFYQTKKREKIIKEKKRLCTWYVENLQDPFDDSF